LVQRRSYRARRRCLWLKDIDIFNSTMCGILTLWCYKHHISLRTSLRVALYLLLHIWSCNRMISSFSESIDMISSCICGWIWIGASLSTIHNCRRYEHLWSVTGTKLIRLIRLWMGVLGHIKIFIDQIIVYDLMTIDMWLLSLLLTILIQWGYS
jgi:hypothetical protein